MLIQLWQPRDIWCELLHCHWPFNYQVNKSCRHLAMFIVWITVFVALELPSIKWSRYTHRVFNVFKCQCKLSWHLNRCPTSQDQCHIIAEPYCLIMSCFLHPRNLDKSIILCEWDVLASIMNNILFIKSPCWWPLLCIYIYLDIICFCWQTGLN